MYDFQQHSYPKSDTQSRGWLNKARIIDLDEGIVGHHCGKTVFPNPSHMLGLLLGAEKKSKPVKEQDHSQLIKRWVQRCVNMIAYSCNHSTGG